jgi:hypothetical protein
VNTQKNYANKKSGIHKNVSLSGDNQGVPYSSSNPSAQALQEM